MTMTPDDKFGPQVWILLQSLKKTAEETPYNFFLTFHLPIDNIPRDIAFALLSQLEDEEYLHIYIGNLQENSFGIELYEPRFSEIYAQYQAYFYGKQTALPIAPKTKPFTRESAKILVHETIRKTGMNGSQAKLLQKLSSLRSLTLAELKTEVKTKDLTTLKFRVNGKIKPYGLEIICQKSRSGRSKYLLCQAIN